MPQSVHEPIIGLPDFKIISYQGTKTIEILAEYVGKIELRVLALCEWNGVMNRKRKLH